MNRRRALRLAAVGVGGGLTGCLSAFDGSGSTGTADCDPTPFERFDRSWTQERGGPARARRVTADGLAGDAPFDRRVFATFDGDVGVRPTLADAETLCCQLVRETTDGRDIEFVFLDVESGEELWRVGLREAAPSETFTPPDETTGHDVVYVSPSAIADGTVYAGVGYATESSADASASALSSAVFALDAQDGSVEWSRTTTGGVASLDRTGRLYTMGYADGPPGNRSPRDRTTTGGRTAETGSRLHVRALNARTGDACWEWSADLSGSTASLVPHGVIDGRFLVTRSGGDARQPRHHEVSLFGVDVESGDGAEPAEYLGPPNTATLGAAGRLVLSTQGPPTEDATVDGAAMSAFDPDSGEVDWVVPAPGGYLGAATEDAIVTYYEKLTGVDPATGETLWEVDAADRVACVVGETLVTYDPTRPEVRTRSLGSGDVRARTPLDGEEIPSDSGVIATGGRLFLAVGASSEIRLVALH